MCTVTFIPQGGNIIFTSNRDETIARPLAFAPALEIVNGKQLVFPKDPKAGGTWFCVAENGVVIVLLNGAFIRHIPTGNYRRSRGLVLLDIISADYPFAEVTEYNYEGIEPFTLLLYKQGSDSNSFSEFRWDGKQQYFKELSLDQPCIYSSATLYEPAIIKQRQKWFDEFLKNGEDKTPQAVRLFHHSAGKGDSTNGLVINRGELLKTQCITQAVIGINSISLYHHNLIKDTEYQNLVNILHA